MDFELQEINIFDTPEWDKLVLNMNKHSFFCSSAWAHVLYETYKYKPHYLCLFDQKKLVLLIPLMEIKNIFSKSRVVSLPFSDFCDPVISPDYTNKELIQYLFEYCKTSGWECIELRGKLNFSSLVRPSLSFYEHILWLDKSENNMFSKFSNNTKCNIKKAIREGVTFRSSKSWEDLKEYYFLHCITRKRHGIPPQPFVFFKNIYKYIIKKNYGLLCFASYHGKTIAGGMIFHYGENAIYKFNASDSKYLNLRPNNLLLWEIIRLYKEKGYKSINLGRTDLNNRGLRQFKLGWNPEEVIRNYYIFDVNNQKIISRRKSIRKVPNYLLSFLPILVLEIIGKMFYKYIG